MRTHDKFLESQKRILWATYILYILLFPAIIGFVINLIMLYRYRQLLKKDDILMTGTADLVTIFSGHHLWLLRTFIFTMCLGMAGLGTIYYAVGYVIAMGTIVWWFYRIIRGVTALFVFHPVPVWR